MLQVDENIGGRQDQKNQNLRTKMLAVGLMMVLGCFAAMGYFSATTTTSPNVDGMVSNLQHYPYVTITNKTPYDTRQGKNNNVVHYKPPFCSDDPYNVAAQQTWKASSRGACLVQRITAVLTIPDGRGYLTCTQYHSPETSYSIFSIIMKGNDACCVLSSHQTPQTCP